MNQISLQDNKNNIHTAFDRLLEQYQKSEFKIATKEEEAEKKKNKQLLTKTSNYTVDNIVNGMASLQLSFSNVVDRLADSLTTESNKLDELQKAIAVEREHLKQLNRVRLVADALHILEKEHKEKIASLQAKTIEEKETLYKEIAQTKKHWQKEQSEFEIKIQESRELLTKQRENSVTSS